MRCFHPRLPGGHCPKDCRSPQPSMGIICGQSGFLSWRLGLLLHGFWGAQGLTCEGLRADISGRSGGRGFWRVWARFGFTFPCVPNPVKICLVPPNPANIPKCRFAEEKTHPPDSAKFRQIPPNPAKTRQIRNGAFQIPSNPANTLQMQDSSVRPSGCRRLF